MKEVVHITMKAGKVVKGNNALRHFLTKVDGDYILTIEPDKLKRTSPQNRYYHGVVLQTLRQCLTANGHKVNAQQVHDLMRMKFLSETLDVNGQSITSMRSTTELNVEEFGNYIDSIVQLVAEWFGVVVPESEY